MSDPTDVQKTEISDLLASGSRLAAIKLYRESTGCSLAEAKSAVEQFGGVGETPDSQVSGAEPLDERQLDEVLDAAAAGKKLNAVKLYMTYSGQTLRESKLFVESLMQEADESSGAAVESGRSGCFSVFLLLAGLSLEVLRRYC